MGRPRSVAGLRSVVTATRFSEAEMGRIDAVRGSLSRAEWLRWIALRALRTSDTPK